MSIFFKREETAEAARTRLSRLESQHAQAAAEMDSALAALGVSVATEDEPAAAAARTSLTRARERCEELGAALPLARVALEQAQQRAAEWERKRLEREARAASEAVVKAAAAFDAAAGVLAEAHGVVTVASQAEHRARSAAGLPVRNLRRGYMESLALFHAAPALARALRNWWTAAPLPPTNRHFRPLADLLASPAPAEIEETEAASA